MKHTFITHYQDWKEYESWYIMESQGKGMIRITLESGHFFVLSNLFVDETERGLGLGKELLHAAITICKTHSLEGYGQIEIITNRLSNSICDKWYRREGFKFDRLESPIEFDENGNKIEEWSRVYIMTF